MSRCAHCGRRVVERQDVCPHCFGSLKDPAARLDGDAADEAWETASQEPLATIAGFQNAAEAGYFAHELMHRTALPVQLSLDNTFDGIHGYWRTRFLLGVPAAEAQRAAETLQELIDQTEADEWQPAALHEELPFHDAAEEACALERTDERTVSQAGSMHWVPIVLTLAAGTFVLWGVRKLNEPPAHRGLAPVGSAQSELWEDLSRNPKPWVQQLDDAGVRELTIDAQRHEAVLREDIDGDGHFETRLDFNVQIPAR